MLKSYRCSLACTLFLLALVIYAGSSVTYVCGFLARHIPFSRRAWVGLNPSPLLHQPAFAGLIQPILQEHCVACHGAGKHKGDLRLDTLDELMRGGQDGPVLKPGDAAGSALIQCLLSPVDSDGHMPPEDQRQATPEEIALLTWWINAGASAEQKVGDLKPEPELRRLLGSLPAPNEPSK